jgi:hypothetical protein
MIFGYEIVSWDNPNYGKFFWQEWQKNKSLGTAWLDASWRIAHDQAPSVAACGATQQEAQDRVYNERYFNRTRASTAWWWSRWYNAARAAAREPVRALPREVMVPQFRPAAASVEAPGALAERFGIGAQATAAATRGPGGGVLLRDGQTTVAQDPSGGIFARLASANLDNTMPLALGRARSRAEDAVQQYGLSPDSNLVFDRTILASAAGGTPEGSGRLEPARVTETIVQFRQAINGLPVISPSDTGLVRVAVDNDGRVTQVHASVREIEDLAGPGAPCRRGDHSPVGTAAAPRKSRRRPRPSPSTRARSAPRSAATCAT